MKLRRALAYVHWPLRLYVRSVKGAEHIPKAPFIVIANHESRSDGVFLTQWFLARGVPIRYLVAECVHKRSSMYRAYLRVFKAIIVMEANPGAAIAPSLEALRQGDVLGIFPEGKVVHDGEERHVHTGFVRLAMETGVPVLPLNIVRGRGRTLGTVSLVFGKPYHIPRTDDRAQVRCIAEERFAEVLALAPED